MPLREDNVRNQLWQLWVYFNFLDTGFTTISNSHGLETVVLAPSLAGTAALASGGWGNLCERAAGARLGNRTQ